MMRRNSPIHKIFKSTSIQLTAAVLTNIPSTTLAGIEDGPIERDKKVMLISYPKSLELEVDKILNEFSNRVLSVNLFYYNRNLNFIRDRLFSRKSGR